MEDEGEKGSWIIWIAIAGLFLWFGGCDSDDKDQIADNTSKIEHLEWEVINLQNELDELKNKRRW